MSIAWITVMNLFISLCYKLSASCKDIGKMSYVTVPMSLHQYQNQYQDDNVDDQMVDVDEPHSLPQKSLFGKVKSFINVIIGNNKSFSSDYSTVSQNQDQDQDQNQNQDQNQDQKTKNIIRQKKNNAPNSVHCFEDIV